MSNARPVLSGTSSLLSLSSYQHILYRTPAACITRAGQDVVRNMLNNNASVLPDCSKLGKPRMRMHRERAVHVSMQARCGWATRRTST